MEEAYQFQDNFTPASYGRDKLRYGQATIDTKSIVPLTVEASHGRTSNGRTVETSNGGEKIDCPYISFVVPQSSWKEENQESTA